MTSTVNLEIFARILYSRIVFKDIAIKSHLRHDLPTSVNNRVILPFRMGFIFTKLRIFRKNKTIAKISKFTVLKSHLLAQMCYDLGKSR